MKKTGFLHIPRTGGTHLERILNVMGPKRLINLFGANDNQRENQIPIIETMKPGDDKHKRLLNNKNLPTCELFAGHFSYNIEKCFDEPVVFFTILRNPIQRVTSMTKQFLTSKIYKDILLKDSERIGDDTFWDNTYKYLETNRTDGLLVHEVHGFSNYMTKVIAGCDISDPNLEINDDTLNTAICNLKKMRYIGFFEDYKKTIDDILTMFNIDVSYDLAPMKISKIPSKMEEMFTKLNQYDIKLYEAAIKLKEEREQVEKKNVTYVTALLDINRDDLAGNFKRSIETYLGKLEILLKNLNDKNLVIYIEEKYFDFVKKCKPNNTIIKTINQDDIKSSEYYDKIQKIRTDPDWYNQKSWLANSPQANLELYNPLIFQKMHILNDVAQSNPFNGKHFAWIDAGITNAQASPSMFNEDWFENKIYKELDKFLFINFPYSNFTEIHGFKKEGLQKYVNVDINRVTRATFFGGTASYIEFMSNKFREIAHKTLDDGFLGTEESIYTILSYLYPNKLNLRMINNAGLVRKYFSDLKSDNIKDVVNINNIEVKPQYEFLPKPYKGVNNQQHPKAFKTFIDFFKHNPDIDLIVDIGAGHGGFTLFLHEQCKKIDCKLISYEKDEGKCNSIQTYNSDIDIRCRDVTDVFTLNEVEIAVSKSKKTLILCDGGDNAGDVKRFSDIIKKGDIIMGHDYAPNKSVFKQKYENKIWNWLELSDEDIQECIKKNKLVDFYPKMNDVAWMCKIKTANKIVVPVKDLSELNTNLYILTFNFPKQLQHTINSMEKTSELLSKPNLYLLDNSTNDEAKKQNQKICEKYNFTYIDNGGNIGINGGRQVAAEHFHASDADFYFFFEDDMTLNGPTEIGKFCGKGFRKYVPDLYKIVHKIMIKEKFDFLKLSFTEVYWDNNIQTSWYNVPQHVRTEYWPEYHQLPVTGADPNSPRTIFNTINEVDGLSYITGDVFYCNWPMIVSREGNKKMFIDTKWANPYEQTWMSHMFKQTKKGNLKPAVLLASPIWHDRIEHYKFKERREN